MAEHHVSEYRGSFQQLADARRVLKMMNRLRTAPVLAADERMELERIRALAICTIEMATEELIDTLDALHDPDSEPNGDELDGSSPEEDPCFDDDFYAGDGGGPGCPLSDPGEDEAHDEQAAWLERDDQTLPLLPNRTWASYRNGEDAEDENDHESEEGC